MCYHGAARTSRETDKTRKTRVQYVPSGAEMTAERRFWEHHSFPNRDREERSGNAERPKRRWKP